MISTNRLLVDAIHNRDSKTLQRLLEEGIHPIQSAALVELSLLAKIAPYEQPYCSEWGVKLVEPFEFDQQEASELFHSAIRLNSRELFSLLLEKGLFPKAEILTQILKEKNEHWLQALKSKQKSFSFAGETLNDLLALYPAMVENLREETLYDYFKAPLQEMLQHRLEQQQWNEWLCLACKLSNSLFVELACEMGADVNHKDQHGRTPLMISSTFLDAQSIRVLKAAGADVQMMDENGRTAMEYHPFHKQLESYLLLREV